MANSNYTITLQQVINLASTHIDLLPLSGVGGYTNEPALSLCNDALSDLIAIPNDWKFNSLDMPLLVTLPNKQDYLFAGATAFTTAGGAAIALASDNAITQSGYVTTVNTLETHRFKVNDTVFLTGMATDAYNSIYTDDGSTSVWSSGWTITAVTAKSFTYTHTISRLGISGAPGIYDYGWLAAATVVEMNNGSSPQHSEVIQAVKDIQPWSRVGNPDRVSIYRDNGNGVLTIRFKPVPSGTIWGAKLVYQGKAPLKTSLADTWAPFPDHYSAVYRQAILYRMFRYMNSPRADAEYQKLQQEIVKAQGADDNEQSDIHVVPEDNLLDLSWGW